MSAMYDELAGWFQLLTAPEEYEGEAAVVLRLLGEAVDGPLLTTLELGSGGGNMASRRCSRLRLTLTDLSPSTLGTSRGLNPGSEHLVGDMRSLGATTRGATTRGIMAA